MRDVMLHPRLLEMSRVPKCALKLGPTQSLLGLSSLVEKMALAAGCFPFPFKEARAESAFQKPLVDDH